MELPDSVAEGQRRVGVGLVFHPSDSCLLARRDDLRTVNGMRHADPLGEPTFLDHATEQITARKG